MLLMLLLVPITVAHVIVYCSSNIVSSSVHVHAFVVHLVSVLMFLLRNHFHSYCFVVVVIAAAIACAAVQLLLLLL